MEHVLATLESTVSPAALAAGTNPALTVGKINVGKVLYDLYSEIDDKANTAVVHIIELSETYTPAEFRDAVKGAQEMATAQDAATGFKAKEGAKGAELYGPARRNINTRMSEAKQIFGVAKMAPAVVREKGYFSALTAARDWLGLKGMKWDGARALTTDEKKAKKTQKANEEAIDMAKRVLPQMPGESIANYMVRVGAKAEAIKESLAIEQLLKQIQGLEEIASEDDVLSAVFEYIRGKGPDSMEACAKQLEEQAAEDRAKADKKAVEEAPM